MGHVGRVNLSLTHDAVFSKVVLFLMDCFYTSIIAKKLLIKVAHFSLHEGKKTEQNMSSNHQPGLPMVSKVRAK